MLLGQQYKILLNHSSHKINLISNSPNTFIYGVEVLDNDKKLFFYEWHVQKGSDKDCSDCWFTSAVSPILSAHYGSIYLGKENGVLLGFSVGIICVTFACWKLYIDDWRDDED